MNNHILVVEDDFAIRDVLQSVLELHNYQVSLAEDGLAALELLMAMARVPDLILLDFTMPRMSGYDFAKAIHNHKSLASMPIILLSANIIDSAIVKEMQVDAFLKKPFTMSNLLDKVAAFTQKPSTIKEDSYLPL